MKNLNVLALQATAAEFARGARQAQNAGVIRRIMAQRFLPLPDGSAQLKLPVTAHCDGLDFAYLTYMAESFAATAQRLMAEVLTSQVVMSVADVNSEAQFFYIQVDVPVLPKTTKERLSLMVQLDTALSTFAQTLEAAKFTERKRFLDLVGDSLDNPDYADYRAALDRAFGGLLTVA